MEGRFTGLLGSRSAMQVFEFYSARPYQDCSLAELERGLSLSYVTLRKGFERLRKEHVLVKSRQVGRARLYRLNEQSNITIGLKLIERELGKKNRRG
jgi:DNA-binding transcriptional ArsR family regulator